MATLDVASSDAFVELARAKVAAFLDHNIAYPGPLSGLDLTHRVSVGRSQSRLTPQIKTMLEDLTKEYKEQGHLCFVEDVVGSQKPYSFIVHYVIPWKKTDA